MEFFIPLINTLVLGAAFVALIVGLFSAPWQVLMLLLLGGLWLTQKLMQDNQRRLADENSSIDFPQIPNRR